MDLSNERSPYYRLRDQDPIEWHLWRQSTVELARRQNKDLRVVIGSYYSQDAHFLEKSRYQDEEVAKALNERFINVIVDRDELPAFEHFYRSIPIWFMNEFEASTLFINHANLPLVLVLDGQTSYPKGLRNEMLVLDLDLHFGDNPKHKLVADELNTGNDTEKVIQFPQARKSDLEITFTEYLENIRERESRITDESTEQLWQALESIRSDTHPTGSNLLPNVMKLGKVAAYLMHDARLRLNGEESGMDLAASMLTRLARSSFFDHLAGGFFQSRVAVSDAIPSAEKRLTVSAYLLEVYCRALSMGADSLFESVARLTADFMKDQVTSENTFPTTISDLSQLGASHYTWNKLTLKRLLSEDELLLIETLYGIDRRPNYERSYLLERQDSWLSVVDRLFLKPDEASELLKSARQKMLEARKDSELVADDRVDPLTCAAMSKALVIAATQFDERAYFEVAKRVMSSTCEKFDLTSSEGSFDTSGPLGVRLKTVHALFMIDALLVLIEYEWDSKLYGVATRLWESVKANGLEVKYQTYCKPQVLGRDKPKDFNAVPDLFPIFDYQSDRLAETTVLMDVARKIGCLNQDDHAWDIYFSHAEALERSIERNQVEHIEYLQQIEHTEIPHASIILRGPLDDCQHWRANLSIPQDVICSVYVIPNELDPEIDFTPKYLPAHADLRMRNPVVAVFSEQGEPIQTFTDLKDLNSYFQL